MTFESHGDDLGAFDQYLSDIDEHDLFDDREQEREMAERAREGDLEAAHRLVEANLRFVISYVKKYQGKGLTLEELVSIGNVGLLKAVQKFDPDKGVKFITYAVWWIRQTVLKALAEEQGSIRLPQSKHTEVYKVREVERTLKQDLGRTPTDDEVAEEFGAKPEKVRLLRKVSQSEVRFDAPLKKQDRDSATMHETYADDDQEDIEGDVERRSRRAFLEEMFATYLTDRERKILVLYYGLDDGTGHTLEEIGNLYGITRERIRQIRNRTFTKLRESEDGEALEGFWHERRAS